MGKKKKMQPHLCKYPEISLQKELIRQGYTCEQAVSRIKEVYEKIGMPLSTKNDTVEEDLPSNPR